MEPSEKSPEMEQFLEQAFGRTSAIKGNICVWCKRPIIGFKDDWSRKEYTTSGLCQDCQDEVFKEC